MCNLPFQALLNRAVLAHQPFITLSGTLLEILHQRQCNTVDMPIHLNYKSGGISCPDKNERVQQRSDGVRIRKPAPRENYRVSVTRLSITDLYCAYQHTRRVLIGGSLLVKWCPWWLSEIGSLGLNSRSSRSVHRRKHFRNIRTLIENIRIQSDLLSSVPLRNRPRAESHRIVGLATRVGGWGCQRWLQCAACLWQAVVSLPS